MAVRLSKRQKNFVYQSIRRRYQLKRHRQQWIKRKINKVTTKKLNDLSITKRLGASYVELTAPKDFSLINNTDAVLSYLEKARTIFSRRDNVTFDISDIETMTPETIAVLVACVKSPTFSRNGNSRGNAPQKTELEALFCESGFLDQVTHSYIPSNTNGNLLHREHQTRVVPSIVKKACIIGTKHTKGIAGPFVPLYDIILECMANTNNHGHLYKQGECMWWLNVYKNPNNSETAFTFLDLGVGIFKSARMTSLLKEYSLGTPLYRNINVVDDLLSGKIQSRMDEDRSLRGRGIPQIAKHAKLPDFKEFYLITNDVKIDLKTGEKFQLQQDFQGTLFHWVLQKT